MFKKALSAVEDFSMLNKGDTVIAGISGGADSMAMLHFLMSIREQYSLNIIAAHINHGLRGEEALRDETFVRDFCKANSVRFEVLHADVRKEAEQSGESTEECGRRIRYAFFESLSPNAKIATAHTASDNAETMLFNLARGSALKGLCGIPPVRGNVIRPLIYCTRQEIERYCEENELSFVTDSTNLTLDYSRNKIRHIAVPALREINPSFEASAMRFAKSSSLDEDYLSLKTRELLESAETDGGYAADVLLSAHQALLGRAVLTVLKDVSPEKADSKTVALVIDVIKNGGKLQIENDLFATCRKGVLFFEHGNAPQEDWSEELPQKIDVGDAFSLKGMNLVCVNKNVFLNTQKIHKDILDYCIDCDKIKGKAFATNRRAGDKITLYKRKCTKTLKKLFNESGIPAGQRSALAVLRDENGVLWVQGFGADKRCMADKNTKKFLIIDFGGFF